MYLLDRKIGGRRHVVLVESYREGRRTKRRTIRSFGPVEEMSPTEVRRLATMMAVPPLLHQFVFNLEKNGKAGAQGPGPHLAEDQVDTGV